MTDAGSGPAAWRFERRAMGSPLRHTVTGVDEATASAASATASDLVEELEESLSRFRTTSDLTALNRRAGEPAPAPVGPLLARALAAAASARRRTGGAFDPRLLADMEQLGYRGADLAAIRIAGGARSDTPSSRPVFADGRWLRLEPHAGRAAVAAAVDLGGIGKGLALRWAFGRIARLVALVEGGRGALLEAGGDLVGRGPAPQGGPWLVGIEEPTGGEERAVVAVPKGAVATSSIRVHAWRTADGRAVHHLLDPRTGEPGGAGLASVTVAAPDPAWAEVWSKALFLEGRRGIGSRARALGLDMTPAARLQTAWVASET